MLESSDFIERLLSACICYPLRNAIGETERRGKAKDGRRTKNVQDGRRGKVGLWEEKERNRRKRKTAETRGRVSHICW